MKSNVFRPACLIAIVAIGLAGCGSSGGTGASSVSTTKPLSTSAFVTVPPIITSPETTTTVAGGGSLAGEQTYTVQAGDIMVRIAKLYGVSPADLATYNQWEDGFNHPIYPGDTIKIPPGAIAVDPTTITAAPVATAEPSATPAETTTTVDAGAGGIYVVADGDTLFGIAKKNGTTAIAIAEANAWSDSIDHVIFAGMKIKLPAKAG